MVYELMTGKEPRFSKRFVLEARDIGTLIPDELRGVLAVEHMRKIVKGCWDGGFVDAGDAKAAVVNFLEEQGWEVEGNDDLKGFDAAALLS